MPVRLSWLAGVMALWCAGIVEAQVPPPPPASPTLWSFLGIPQGLYKMNSQLFNRRGNFPGLEKKPPLKAIADVENLKSEIPAIKAAAEIKQAEDLKPQKIKAIKYLAQIGCGCYDKDEKVTKAILAATEDCTEEVRLAAVQSVAEAAQSERCENCKQRSCCSEKLAAQLSKMAYERDDEGCYIEPSERVREAAIEALCVCCPGGAPPTEQATTRSETVVEGADRPQPVEGANPPPSDKPADNSDPAPQPPPPVLDPTTSAPPADVHDIPRPVRRYTKLTSSLPVPSHAVRTRMKDQPPLPPSLDDTLGQSRRTLARAAQSVPPAEVSVIHQPLVPAAVLRGATSDRGVPAVTEPQSVRVHKRVAGHIVHVTPQGDLLHLHLEGQTTLPAGTAVKVYHANQVAAVLEVTESQTGWANARITTTMPGVRIGRGDEIEAWH